MATLVKWHFVGATEYDAVLLSDLDVDLLPVASLRSPRLGWQTEAQVRSDWEARLPELLARRHPAQGDKGVTHADGTTQPAVHCVFAADQASPVNAALFLLLPSRGLYDDGLAVLREPFSVQRGWNLTGPPSAVVRPPLLHTDGRLVKHVDMRGHRAWSFVGADIDQGFFAYMMLGRHRVGRYSGLAHRPPAALVHHVFRKPWAELRLLQATGSRTSAEASPNLRSAWPHGWAGAPVRAACAAFRYLRAIPALRATTASSPSKARASPCLSTMGLELEAVASELAHGPKTPWPLCIEDCKAAPDNAGGLLFAQVAVF